MNGPVVAILLSSFLKMGEVNPFILYGLRCSTKGLGWKEWTRGKLTKGRGEVSLPFIEAANIGLTLALS